MNVYVIMSNDFPHKVFSSKERAEGYVDGANEIDNEHARNRGGPRIYYRVHCFELIEE